VTNFQIADLFKTGITRKHQKGQILIYEGDPVSQIHYIEEGYVKAYSIQNNGTENIIFIYGPGDVFPLRTYLSGKRIIRYFYSCISDVHIRAIPGERLENQIKNNIEVAELLVEYAYQINQQFFERIETLSVNHAQRKVIALLAFLVEKTGSKELMSELDIPLTQQDLASMSGLTRESISRQLTSLRKQGLITKKTSGTIVINIDKLKEFLEKLSIIL
jgi:CRP-like cAMP-binding protein